jgi:HAD superfamily hydrolase (TIGR01509 family)
MLYNLSSMKDIKFVYFDFGGVMTHWKPGVAGFANTFKVDEADLFKSLYDHFPDAVRGTISTNEMWERIKRDMKIEHTHENYADLFASYFIPIAETHAFAKSLKDRYKIGILSNIEPDTLKHSFERGHLGDVSFDVVLESHHVGHVKPELEFFQIAQKKAGIQHAHEMFFTDDLMENVDAAKKMGWHAIQFDPFNPEKSIREIKEYLGT